MIDRRSRFGISVVNITDDIKSECEFVPYPYKGVLCGGFDTTSASTSACTSDSFDIDIKRLN